MTLTVTPADVAWFLSTVPGATKEEIDRFRERGQIVINDEEVSRYGV